LLQLEARKSPADAQGKLSRFFAKASRTSSRALLLDYDGTLAPFCVDRDAALPYPTVRELLEKIRSSANTRLVIATGRRAKNVARLLGLQQVEIWGCHGWERLHADGTHEVTRVDQRVLDRISEANDLLLRDRLSDLLEFKPAATAVHWRGLEAASKELACRVQRVWSTLSAREGLQLLSFDGGIEIRAAARNKGDVVRTIVAEMGRGASVAYLGDDETDEDAFTALQGLGLGVLVQSEYRPTVADVWIRPPDGVIAFLTDWANAWGGTS
jgi:trehalose 6-phosphate phosphatase